DALADPVAATADWAEAADAFRAEHCSLDDGGASQRVLDLVLPGCGSGGRPATGTAAALPEPRGGDDASAPSSTQVQARAVTR
ncbi:MAG: hypothetical protein PGN11_14930, partial [Quadrisphaera sp.]